MMPVPPAPEGEINFSCSECRQPLHAPAAMAGKPWLCPQCGTWAEVPHQEAAGSTGVAAGLPQYDPYGLSERSRLAFENRRTDPQQQEGGMGNAAIGWLIFFLIFGVGNVILYATTGIFLIPIPRR